MNNVQKIATTILAAEQINFSTSDLQKAIQKLSNMSSDDILEALTKDPPGEGLADETKKNTVVMGLKHSGKFNFTRDGLNTWYTMKAYDKTVETKPVTGTVYVFWNGKEIFAAY